MQRFYSGARPPATLRPRGRSLRYVDAVQGVVHGLDLAGTLAPQLGVSILDPELLLAALPIGHLWDPDAFAAARDADVEAWLETERASDRWDVPGSARLVNQTLRRAGLPPPTGARTTVGRRQME